MTNRLFVRVLVCGACATAAFLAACTSVIDSGKPVPAACFMKIYGGELDEGTPTVRQTSDGGYIVAGSTFITATNKDVELVKLDPQGNKLWDSTYGGSNEETAMDVMQTGDGGYAVVGSTLSYPGSYNVYLVRTDATGHKAWEQHYGGSGEEHGWRILPTAAGGFAIGGDARNGSNGSLDFYLVRVDGAGKSIGEKYLSVTGGSYDEYCHALITTSTGGYLMAGSWNLGSNPRVAVIKTDSAGGSASGANWPNKFGDVYAAAELSPTRFLLFGYTIEIGQSTTQASIVVDTVGTGWGIMGQYGTRGVSQFNGGQLTADGGAIAVGSTTGSGNGAEDILLVKFDASGAIQWAHTFGGGDEDIGNSVQQTSDGGYVLAGTTKSYGSGRTGRDIIVLKVDPDGNLCN